MPSNFSSDCGRLNMSPWKLVCWSPTPNVMAVEEGAFFSLLQDFSEPFMSWYASWISTKGMCSVVCLHMWPQDLFLTATLSPPTAPGFPCSSSTPREMLPLTARSLVSFRPCPCLSALLWHYQLLLVSACPPRHPSRPPPRTSPCCSARGWRHFLLHRKDEGQAGGRPPTPRL